MARHARIEFVDCPMHVRQIGVDWGDCFRSTEDRRLYLGLLQELAPHFGCEIHAYVLMSNHVHLLLTPRMPGACSRMMKHVGQRYSQYANRHWQRRGHFWEGRFRSNLVDSASYALTLHRYIELNPVRAGMVRHPAEFPWSSFRANAMGMPGAFLTNADVYLALHDDEEERRLAYRALFDVPECDAELTAIRKAIRSGSPLGPQEFIDRMKKASRRAAVTLGSVPGVTKGSVPGVT